MNAMNEVNAMNKMNAMILVSLFNLKKNMILHQKNHKWLFHADDFPYPGQVALRPDIEVYWALVSQPPGVQAGPAVPAVLAAGANQAQQVPGRRVLPTLPASLQTEKDW